MTPDDYVGIPYVDKGRTTAGVDCWGLARLFYADQFGIELPALDGEYDTGRNREQVAETVRQQTAAHWSAVTVPCYGDVVILTISQRPFHVGIVLDDGYFLHALCVAQATVIDRLDSPRWRNRIEGYYQHERRRGADLPGVSAAASVAAGDHRS